MMVVASDTKGSIPSAMFDTLGLLPWPIRRQADSCTSLDSDGRVRASDGSRSISKMRSGSLHKHPDQTSKLSRTGATTLVDMRIPKSPTISPRTSLMMQNHTHQCGWRFRDRWLPPSFRDHARTAVVQPCLDTHLLPGLPSPLPAPLSEPGVNPSARGIRSGVRRWRSLGERSVTLKRGFALASVRPRP